MDVRIGEGSGERIDQSNLHGLPSLVAGMFNIPSLPGHRFAYSFLKRRRDEWDLLLTVDEEGDFLPSLPGQERHLGSWESSSRMNENWVGLSWAHTVTPGVSVGVSTFGWYLGRKRRITVASSTLTDASDVWVVSRLRDFQFRSYGLLWKAGIAGDLGPVRLGLSVTTPGIDILGSGSIRYEDLWLPEESSGGDPIPEGIVIFRDEDLASSTRSPLSLGAGISWILEHTELHLSGEWFAGVPLHRILGADSIPSQSSGETGSYEVVEELEPVFNLGVGLEMRLSETFSAYGSVIRDASAAPKEAYSPLSFLPRVSNSTSRADGSHVGAGVSMETRWIDLTAGVTYGSTLEITDPPPETAGLGPRTSPATDRMRIERSRWRFLIGFTVPMVEEISDDPPEKR